MENLTVGQLKDELLKWPELNHYIIEVDGRPLIIDDNGNCFARIEGANASVSLITANDKYEFDF